MISNTRFQPDAFLMNIRSLLRKSVALLRSRISSKWSRYYEIPGSVSPVSGSIGFDRGQPIDRYYIEEFLSAHSSDIKGRTLEFGNRAYTLKFGGNKVVKSDVLCVEEGNPEATIIADLTGAHQIQSGSFDCIIMTQTLQMIYDFHPALMHLHRILKPGGVLLVTTHGISKICRREGRDQWGEYWRFTAQSIRKIFLGYFPDEKLTIEVYGNVLAAVSFLHGLAAHELSKSELDFRDPDFEVLIAVRAVKSENSH
jgi:SAM-dependent methyltransferase